MSKRNLKIENIRKGTYAIIATNERAAFLGLRDSHRNTFDVSTVPDALRYATSSTGAAPTSKTHNVPIATD
jgi:hypothetical protein